MSTKASESINFKPIASQKVSETIYDQIREMIIKGELKPNDHLPSERALALEFQRSRPTIREALRMLERSGFIETFHGKGGARIKELTSDAMQQPLENIILLRSIPLKELYEFRAVNETAFINWATERRTDEDLKEIEKIISSMKKAGSDWKSVLKLDSQFHGAIAKAAKNEVARVFYQVVSQPVLDIYYKEFEKMSKKDIQHHCSSMLEENIKMLQIIKEQKPQEAQSIMMDHLEKFKNIV